MNFFAELIWKFRLKHKKETFWPEGYIFLYLEQKTKDYEAYKHYITEGKSKGLSNGETPPSNFFFPEGYLYINQDVKDAKLDPWHHYVQYGHKEGRGNGLNPPAELFNPEGYLKLYDDIKKANVDPWKHYILNGLNEGRQNGKYYNFNDTNITNVLDYDLLISRIATLSNNKIQIDIILPIFNGYEYLNNLFETIKLNTDLDYKLIIINDCSTDPRVNELIGNISTNQNNKITVIQNSSNLGFVKSVNKALKFTTNDVVILNSDIVLPKNWASRLFYPILNDKNVASVTPFSNAATIFSLPEIDKNNKLEVDLEQLNNQIKDLSIPFRDIRFPTGVGFCMAMSRKALNIVGYLDEIFHEGYGEENDWCQRAIQKGFYNAIAGNLFVYHKHGGSFLPVKKQSLMERNSKILINRFKNYDFDVCQMHRNPLYTSLRFLLISKIFKLQFSKSTVVFDHSWGGGTETYIQNEITKIKGQELFIRIQKISSLNEVYLVSIYTKVKEYKLEFDSLRSIFNYIEIINPDSIIINNLAGYKTVETVCYIKKFHIKHPKTKLVYKVHDYQCICPSINLINNGYYCNNSGDRSICSNCWNNWKNNPDIPIKCNSIQQYQESFADLMQIVSEITCFSKSSSEIISNWFDNKEKIQVIPHSITPLKIPHINDHTGYNVAIIGDIGICKGYKILCDIDKLLPEYKNITFLLFGSSVSPFKNIKNKGRYQVKELPNLLEENQIDLAFFPSIWPETFSYVISELISMQIPIVCFNLGAQAEKVSKYNKGYILDNYSSGYILSTISILSKKGKI